MKISGVIGVIVITFIVIFVASLTYSQVESIREAQNKKTGQIMDGSIKSIQKNTSIKIDGTLTPYWTVSLTDSSSENNMYYMIFEDAYPPLQNIPLRFYYRNVTKDDTTYLWITQIEQR